MRDPGRSTRIILFLGVGAFALLWISSVGLKNTLTPDEEERIGLVASRTDFDGARAMKILATLSGQGPRPSGKLPPETGRLLETQVGATLVTGKGVPHYSTLCRGSTPENVVLLAKLFTAADSAGANASASGAATVMEIASLFGRSRRGLGVACVWLTEEASGSTLKEALQIYTPKVVFAIEGVGDCYLGLGSNPDAPPWLNALLWDTAEGFGTGKHFRSGRAIPDRLALRAWQPLTLYVCDPIMGGSIARHAALYNTPLDTAEQICPDSLQAVGDVLYHAIQGCDTYLARGR